MTTTKLTARAQEAAHRTSVDYSIKDVAEVLRHQLGQKLTGYIAGVQDAKAVAAWSQGKRKPQPEADKRLRAALQVFVLLQSEENAHTARAWMIGMNPQLGDETPAGALRDGRLKDVLAAARAYIAGG